MVWSDQRLSRVEGVIAWCRFTVVMVLVVTSVTGLFPEVRYPLAFTVALAVSLVVSAVGPFVLPRWLEPARQAQVLTVVETLCVLALLAATGGSRSAAAPFLSFPVTLAAMRFNTIWALALAGGQGAGLFLIGATLPAPTGSNPMWFAGWWGFVLLVTAILVGTLTRLADEEHARRLAATEAATRERHQRWAAEELSRQREELMRVVVHEFRTPVASLEGLARHLADSQYLQGDAATGKALRFVQSHAEHLSEMIDALRQAATSGRPGAMDRVELHDVFLPDLLQSATIAAGGADGTVAVDVDPACLIARIDATRTRRIVTNLVENALRHNTPDEPVTVVARPAGGSGLQIVVSDRGPGLPEESVPAGEGTHTPPAVPERPGGSGLGLWIVTQLVGSLHGAVHTEPRDGGGLEVHVVLPSAGEAAAESDPAAGDDEADGASSPSSSTALLFSSPGGSGPPSTGRAGPS